MAGAVAHAGTFAQHEVPRILTLPRAGAGKGGSKPWRMKLWVKICGVRSVKDALRAAEAGADAIGVNFFRSSPRRCAPETAARIAAAVGRRIEVIGVFVDAEVDEIVDQVVRLGLTGAQLHGDHSAQDAERVARVLGPDRRVIRAIRADSRSHVVEALAEARGYRVLLDSPRGGGSGTRFAEDTVAGVDLSAAIVAGGLTPANVARVVARLRPYGVDTASGVERAPGKKDETKVKEFIVNARGIAS